ncbi:MAG TPA: SoxR reducing system RseC family protein [Acidobacteriota bacterium]|nr:SoxR reducing system RseC family protein [Acidobacteriota bacterium]
MLCSKGFVTRIAENGSAEVVIQADHIDSIPGAPDIDLCHHCTGCSADLRVMASNMAGAALGDLVNVSHKPGKVAKNVLTLLGIPLMGLVLGTATGVSLYEIAAVQEIGAFLIIAVATLLGITAGTLVYRQDSAGNQPVITQIIRAGATAAPTSFVDPVCGMEVSASTAAANLAYKGVTYYFCHPACLKAFTKDPARYLGGEVVTKRGEST